MPRALSFQANHALRSIALWLGLIALTLQGLVPLCMAGTPAGSGTPIIIGTSHCSEIIRIDTDGHPASDAPHSGQGTCFLCLGCDVSNGFVAPGFAALPGLPSFVHERITFASATVDTTAPRLAYDSRGPPTANETIAI